MKPWLALALLGVAALSGGAGAGEGAVAVYKCTVDGKVSYGQEPCVHGKSVELAVPAAPGESPADAATLARQKRSADGMEQERRRREAKEEREQARAAQAGATQRKKCAALELERKWAAEDAGAASHQHADKAKTKARRAAEKLAVECPD